MTQFINATPHGITPCATHGHSIPASGVVIRATELREPVGRRLLFAGGSVPLSTANYGAPESVGDALALIEHQREVVVIVSALAGQAILADEAACSEIAAAAQALACRFLTGTVAEILLCCPGAPRRNAEGAVVGSEGLTLLRTFTARSIDAADMYVSMSFARYDQE